jgi:hypothetical protein
MTLREVAIEAEKLYAAAIDAAPQTDMDGCSYQQPCPSEMQSIRELAEANGYTAEQVEHECWIMGLAEMRAANYNPIEDIYYR